MSIYDKSSLVLIPSGTKTGKVYSQKPVNGDGDFTFSRSTAATRVNADGNIEKETQNLLLQSNSFNTTWGNSNSTETSGQSGYDGTSDAWRIDKTASGGYLVQSIGTSGVQTFSVYAKAGTTDWMQLLTLGSGTGSRYVFYDLTNGVIGSQSGSGTYGIDSNIESVGGGWYRCSLTFNTTLNDVRIYPAEANSVSASSGNILIQDAQLNQGLIAQEVITTTTAAVEGGITDNVPRLDYTDSSCPALLLEPQRTNELTHSEYISGGDSNTTTTFNYGESPEGLDNSIKVEVSSSGYAQKAQAKGGLTANTTYTFSFWLSSESDSADMRIYDNSNGANIIGSTALTIPDSGWERVTQTFTTPAGCTSINVYCLANGGKTAGDVTITWGWQLEEGSYATSYIPTYGTSVTRNVDKVDGQEDASLFNDSEGVLFVEFSALADSGRDNQWRFLISDGSNGNRVQIGLPNATNNLYASCIAGGVTSADMTHTLNNPSSNHKVAIKYKVNDFAMYVDGVEVDTDTSGSTPTGLDIFDFYRTPNNNNYVEANVNQVLYFKTALSNEELADLTTL